MDAPVERDTSEVSESLMLLTRRMLETVAVMRECDWNVEPHELVYLLTSLEKEANEAGVTHE